MIGNTYWLINRRANQRTPTQAIPRLSLHEFTGELLPSTLHGVRLLPSWIFLAMILVATLGICSSVILRSKEELKASTIEHSRMRSDIANIRRSNLALQGDIRGIASDPIIIESAARERLGMVRPSDIVVPIRSTQAVSNFGTLSFVR